MVHRSGPESRDDGLTAEDALRYRMLYEQSPLPYQSLDEQGRLIDVNPAWLATLGHERAEVIGRSFADFLHPDWREHFARNFPEFKRRGVVHDVRFRMRRADGRHIDVSFEGCIGYEPDGRMRQTYCVFQDITERLAAERKLRESEELYRVLFQSSPLAMFLSTPHTLENPNRAALELFGYSAEEFARRGPQDVSPTTQPDGTPSAAMVTLLTERVLAGEPQHFQWRHQRKDGTTFDADVHLNRVDIGGQPHLFAIVEDITDRLAAESTLRESAKRTELALLGADLGSWDWELATGRVVFDDRWAGMLGYRRSELDASVETWRALLHPDDREVVESQLAAHLAGRTPFYETEHRLRHKDGHWVWVLDRGQVLERDADGQPLRVCGTHLDITQRRQDEAQQRRSEERFRSLMEHTTEGFYLFEPVEPIPTTLPAEEQITRLYRGTIVECNDAQARMYGHARAEEVVGLTLADLHGGSDNPENRAFLRDWIARGYRLAGAVSEETDRDGETVWFSNNVLGIVEDGLLVRVWGTQTDITEMKQAEAEREHLQRQLAQAQKMEAVGRLAGGVAHDFNNMLTVILGNVQLALEEPGLTEPLRRSLLEVDGAAQRSADLTRQLLAFARKQTVAPQVLDLNETVEGMLKMLRRLIGEDIDLAWLPAPRLGAVRIDPGQIDQILANLCVNARDAIAGVGRVTIETENVTLDAEYCADHPGYRPGDYVQLSVADDGCGMDQATLASVFEPFFTTKAESEGTGLGLSTVYGIVKQNEGFINVYSEPGQGTVFRVFLPRHAQPQEPAPTQRAAPLPGGTETILLVEDESAILALGQAMLGSLGYRILTAGSPEAALAAARERPAGIDLLITDVVLPGMNGRQLAEALRADHPGLRTLFMSGYTANVIAHHGVLEDGVAFIQKPFSRGALARKVRDALDRPGT